MNIKMTSIMAILSLASISLAKDKLPPSLVDYAGFVELTETVGAIRAERLIPLNTFLEMARDPDTILLDTRSKAAYDRKHIKGAVHLNFSDFTAEKLEKVIPSKNTRILIYCNNNIEGDADNFQLKMAPVALNIPTFINLYEYGYHNVYELFDLVPADYEKLEFAGTSVMRRPVRCNSRRQ